MVENMKDYLYKPFISYVEKVKLHFESYAFNKSSDNVFEISRSHHLRSIVSQLEQSKEFSSLISNYSIAFGDKPIKKTALRSIRYHDKSIHRNRLKNFFRRSKLYIKFSENIYNNSDVYFEHLWSASNGRKVKTTSFRLIEAVSFPECDVDFGKFKIQNFTKTELDMLVDNQLNQFFYPYAELDTKALQNFWFIVEKSYKTYSKIDAWAEIDDEPLLVSRTFPDKTIQLLSLFEWENKSLVSGNSDDDMILGWLKFSVPWSFKISDDIFKNPFRIQDLPELPYSPCFDNQGKEVGTKPLFYFDLETDDLGNLKSIVEKAKIFLDSINLEECKWTFLSRAMGYFAKAFTTEEDKFEELLWHITVLDILLGEKIGVMDNIRRRLGIIYGKKNNKEIKEVRKKFKELYDFRSDLVHGKDCKQKKIYLGHLKSARTLARNTLIWFIDTLASIHSELNHHSIQLECYPERDELLFIFDFCIKNFKRKFNGSDFTKLLVNISELKRNSKIEIKNGG